MKHMLVGAIALGLVGFSAVAACSPISEEETVRVTVTGMT